MSARTVITGGIPNDYHIFSPLEWDKLLALFDNDIELIIPGGMVRKNEDSLYDPFASNNIKDIFVTIGFFCCSGIDAKIGITSHHMGETQVSREMIGQSQTSIILADHSKFGNIAFNRTAKFEEIDMIITDQEISKEEHQLISQQGAELISTDLLEE